MRNDWTDFEAPSLDDLEMLARQAFDALPKSFRALVGEVSFAIAEFPDDEVIAEMQLESEFDILGLFHGIGMAHASATPPSGVMPNRIYLYRRPILDYWAEHEETLGTVVSHVLVHEIGHHFGLSDDDIDEIEAQAG